MAREKYVLCRPEGGLNDLLCQIGTSLRYAKFCDRRVIIETSFKSARNVFRDYFERYFSAMSPDLIFGDDALIASLQELSVVPEELQRRINNYEIVYSTEKSNWVDAETGVKLTFNFERIYDQDVLVHHQCGGGLDSIFALEHLSITRPIAEELIRRLTAIGKPYTAVHIRNTDYSTSIERHMDFLHREVIFPLFVATDNSDSLAACSTEFGSANIISFSQLPDVSGVPIHSTQTQISPYDRNVEAIVDLLCLAFAHKFIRIPLDRDGRGVDYSGFTNLAQGLRERPDVLQRLVGEDVYQLCLRVTG